MQEDVRVLDPVTVESFEALENEVCPASTLRAHFHTLINISKLDNLLHPINISDSSTTSESIDALFELPSTFLYDPLLLRTLGSVDLNSVEERKVVASYLVGRIQDVDSFRYTSRAVYVNKSSVLHLYYCTQSTSTQWRRAPEKLPQRTRHSNPRQRFDCGGKIAITFVSKSGSVSASIHYAHQCIHGPAQDDANLVPAEVKDFIAQRIEEAQSPREIWYQLTRQLQHDTSMKQVYYWWKHMFRSKYERHPNELHSAKLLLEEFQSNGMKLLTFNDGQMETSDVFAFSTVFMAMKEVDVSSIKAIFVDAT
jgi:hypothetical protein